MKAIAKCERSRSVASSTPMRSLSPCSVVEQEEDGDKADAASIVDHTTEAASAHEISSDYDMASNADVASVTNDSESEGVIDSESDTGESNHTNEPSKFVKMLRERYADDASTAPPINNKLAKAINSMLAKPLSPEREIKITEGLLRRGNVPALSNPRVNKDIWLSLDHQCRCKDMHTSKIGGKLKYSLMANVNVLVALEELPECVASNAMWEKVDKCFTDGL